ncbi:hypothetical protein GCM10017771_08570 [Streptomyces capitiformicae]|uniref:Uncharacterized protein n=1 Tax=Streptomyces capitiformicae TaxID=2014920 RepID=A0A919L2Y1_9ACTN|nr:hypothetical protein GCM10017771_08570 [Streptomyces capitiformicae]
MGDQGVVDDVETHDHNSNRGNSGGLPVPGRRYTPARGIHTVHPPDGIKPPVGGK